jgi:glycosyltransferase involved in cell wall biosynthesis
MRVLFACGREPAYTRNAVLQAALRLSFDVSLAVDATPGLAGRYLRVAARLVRSRGLCDMAVVGFYGHPLVLLARRAIRQPILFDAFISTYDTLCFDRRRFAPDSLPGRAALWLDRTSCQQADLVLLDTAAHAEYFHNIIGVPRQKLRTLFVGCDETLFYPRPDTGEPSLIVLHYGSFQRLHGTEVIVRAASLLGSESRVRFRIIGQGAEYAPVRRLAQELDVHNVEFLPPVALAQLPAEIAGAGICLGGHFGSTDKASRVIAGKTFQFLAMAKPTIVGDNSANRELLAHGQDAVFCQMANPEALAAAIQGLVDQPDLRTYIGENGRQTFLRRAATGVLSAELRQIVAETMLARTTRAG